MRNSDIAALTLSIGRQGGDGEGEVFSNRFGFALLFALASECYSEAERAFGNQLAGARESDNLVE